MFNKTINSLVIITPAPDLTPVLGVVRGQLNRFFLPFPRIDCHLFSFINIPTAMKL